MSNNHSPSVMIILADHDQRVQFRKMAEELGMTVSSAANPIKALDLLRTVKPPDFLILSNQERDLPLMSRDEFLVLKRRSADLAKIPVVEVAVPLERDALAALIAKYCRK